LPNVKLMSPVFNATHPTHEALVGSMNAAGAKWDGLDVIGVNAYNVKGYNINGRSMQTVTEQVGRVKSTLPGRRYFVTETGLYESERNVDPIKSTPAVPHGEAVANMAREAELLRQDGSVVAFLMFNGFATNPDINFQYNKLTPDEWSQIRGAGCGGTITGPDLPPPDGGGGGSGGDGGNGGGSGGSGSCIFPEFLLRIVWEGSSGLVDPSGGGISIPAGTKLNLYVFSSSSGDLARNIINDAVLVYKGAGLDGRRALGVGGMILTPRDPGELSVTTGNYQECGVKSFKIAVTRATSGGQDTPPPTPPVTPPTTPPATTPPATTPPATTPPTVRPPSVTPPAVRPPAVTPPARPTSPVLPETSLPGPTVLLLIASAVLIALAGIITRKYLFRGGTNNV
jgi:hypothetical protein